MTIPEMIALAEKMAPTFPGGFDLDTAIAQATSIKIIENTPRNDGQPAYARR